MADDADRAQEQIEVLEAAARARRPSFRHLKACGACHYCGEAIADARLFCDSECGYAYEYEAARRRQNGAAD